jgi:oxygen-independent coproporphyrinogen-3 oxidase
LAVSRAELVYGPKLGNGGSGSIITLCCLRLRPDRFSVFGYAHVPSFKKHQRMIDEAMLPDGAARHDQAEAIATSLTEAG